LHICALRLVGALDAIAEVMQHLGNAAHAYSADPYEMHEAYALRHLHARVSFLNVSTDLRAAIASVSAAGNCVAAGFTAKPAAAAPAARPAGSFIPVPTRPAARFVGR